ncbi:hypothetical protein [Nocardia terpenica]|uniref:Uncharacterized protein n=1 Tax=Nocardia terpenica TaxID=455432 RepID=A0A6G9ZDT9_9NOCA|nr:hypothetical protein [Nocardia terpenica]QIS23682.1 hypothetical protein F6W96_40820 [Nocardia terpenica]
MPIELPEWALSHLRGITEAEVRQVLDAKKRRVWPVLGGDPRVRAIIGRTTAGRVLLVGIRELAPFDAIMIGARELTTEELAEYTEWEARADEPYEG